MEKGGLIDSNSQDVMHANIPLVINSYEDIFSSFDPRTYDKRALSDDFIIECKKAARDKGEFGVELVLSMPGGKRNLNHEFEIKKRLREHFHKHFLEKERELRKIKGEGVIWVILGIIINVIVVTGLLNFGSNILKTFLGIFEVPSWFFIWEGLGKIFLESRRLEPDYVFYKKMSSGHILFKNA